MTDTSGPVYEVTFNVDREIVDQFDAWLKQHVEDMLQLAGVHQAEVYEEQDDDEGRARRVLQVFFTGYPELERYVAKQAGADRQSAVDRFDGRFGLRSRVLRQSGVFAGESKPAEVCLNCGARLGGQYCGNCGQRAASRLISIWELLRDAFGDLLEFDSRLWRTLIPLMIGPGQLTRDYLRGRRTRYMPPFRMYLVLSIVFFLVAFFDPREELGILFEPQEPPIAASPDERTEGGSIADEVIRDLRRDGIIGEDPAVVTGDAVEGDVASGSNGVTIRLSGDGEPGPECDFNDMDPDSMPDWMARRFTPERLAAVCERVVADKGKAFLRELLDNVPAALFVLLPLMALVLKILYPLSKRFYVEHLLFVVHYHAFVFLVLILQVLMSRTASLLRAPEISMDVVTLALSLYVPVYLYKAQRRVYEQGRFVTVMKFLILALAYFSGLLVIFSLVAIFAAFSI